MKEQSGLKLRRLRRGFHFIAVTFSDPLDDGGVCDGAESLQPIPEVRSQCGGDLSRAVSALNLYGKPWRDHICPSLGCRNDCHVVH
ncbi:hypothetical protein Q7C36_013011 [Tachysurus vachellii]|uniref:Uncharacterized protein n=1 Tax=Tachysurus vachellii TaxID=175792 RepID=A0AA88MR76_TACVA|nr:hypothetical protein Q7C36_013011 [Tachysurus vachellii]